MGSSGSRRSVASARIARWLAWASVAALTSIPAHAASISTGVAPWAVTQLTGPQNSGAALGVSGAAVIETGQLPLASLPGFFAVGWVVPTGDAQWVGQLATDGNFEVSPGVCGSAAPSATCGAIAGPASAFYVYTLTFNSGAAGGTLDFYFTADNMVSASHSTYTGLQVRDNSGVIYAGTAASQNVKTLSPSLAVSANQDVVISALVTNACLFCTATDRNPSGFLLGGTFTPSPVPEPSSALMLGLGGLVVLSARRRRQAAAHR